MEAFITAIQSGSGVIIAFVVIAQISELLMANDLDLILFSKSKQMINKSLNVLILFIVNMFLMIFTILLLYQKVNICKNVKDILDIVVNIFLIGVMIFEIACGINWRQGKISKIVDFTKRNIDKLVYINFFVIDIYGIVTALYAPNLNDNVYPLAITVAFIYSVLLVIFSCLIINMKNKGKKESRFYLIEEGEKYYIYYLKDKFLFCGTSNNFDNSSKYKLFKFDEIYKYEIFRENNKLEG